LLLVFLAQLFLSARRHSATMDEQNHIARGLAYLRTGDLRLSKEHPPLINLICALPLWFDENVSLPLKGLGWNGADIDGFAEEFLWKRNGDGPAIVARARIPIMLLALFLALLVYTWAADLYGPGAGLLALSLLAFDPNVLAHASLATNDLGAALLITLAAYASWRLICRPTWPRAVVGGVALGLALTAKFSAVFLIPALPAVALIGWLSAPGEKRPPLGSKRLLAVLAVAALSATVTVWAIYGFEVSRSDAWGFTIPAASYVDGLHAIGRRLRKESPAFLLGDYSTEGWWYYFPVAFTVKTPLPLLVLLFSSLVYAWRARAWRKDLSLLALCAIYFFLSMAANLNIGYRHLLPLLPFIFILASRIGSIPWKRPISVAWLPAIAAGWLAVSTLSVYPHYLAYFNELAGGPAGGYKILVDSNLDWGQDLPGLREYMAREDIESVKLSYFGNAYPEAYGVEYEPLPSYPRRYEASVEPANPPPGVYAISATNLQGVFFPDRSIYSWFRNRRPDAVIGHSIFIYRLPDPRR
jgi:hypothetical protein